MTISEAVTYFLNARVGLVSPKTARINQQYLSSLVELLGERELASIKLDDLRLWRKQLIERPYKYGGRGRRKQLPNPLSLHTVHGYIRVCRQFFGWLHRQGHIPTNPALGLEQVPISKQVPTSKVMSEETFHRLLQTARGDAPAQVRDRAILWFMRHTGCRLGGVANCLLADLDLAHKRAVVTEKGRGGGKIRLVYLKTDSVRALSEWLEMRSVLPQHSERLFTTVPNDAGLGGGQDLSERAIYAMYYRLRKRAQVRGPAFPHAQRHAFSKRLLTNGANLAAVSKLLGHASTRITGDSYGHYEDHEAQRAHEQFA